MRFEGNILRTYKVDKLCMQSIKNAGVEVAIQGYIIRACLQ